MSSGLQGPEPVVDALLARLRDAAKGLNAEVAVMNADAGDEYVLAAFEPQCIEDFMPPYDEITEFPFCGIVHGPGTFEDDIGSSATGRYEVAVVIWHQSHDQKALTKLIRRYLRCALRSALADRRLVSGSDLAWGTGLVSADPGPSMREEEDPQTWASWCAVTIWARAEEE